MNNEITKLLDLKDSNIVIKSIAVKGNVKEITPYYKMAMSLNLSSNNVDVVIQMINAEKTQYKYDRLPDCTSF